MKECFKCKQVLDLLEFYKHPMMGDGHINKCKKCTRKDSEDRRKIKEKNNNWFLSERKRHREKSQKYREEGRNNSKSYSKKWDLENPEKKKAHMAVKNALRSGRMHRHPCCICGNKAHAHHEDYSKPLEVIWLCPKHHGERHVQINEEKLMKEF